MPAHPEDRSTGEVEAASRRLHSHVIWHWRASMLLSAGALAAVLLLVDRFVDGYIPAMALPVMFALALVWAWVWPPLQYRSWRYQIREHQLWAERGVASRITSVVPYVRIQHVDTRQDLVERTLGIARVVVFTAGIRGAELVLPGVPAVEAERLRDQLAGLAGVEHAV